MQKIYMALPLIKSYKIGSIAVTIRETEQKDKLQVECNDGEFHAAFKVRKYEYENYKRHMNQRIKNAFNKPHEASSDEE